MTQEEYITRAIKDGALLDRKWYLSTFNRLLDSNKYITLEDNKYKAYGEVIDVPTDRPILRLTDEITVTKELFKDVEGNVKSTIGRLILNTLCAEALNYKLGIYINEQFTINDYRDKFLSQVGTGKDSKFTTADIKRLGTAAAFLRQLSFMMVSSSKHTMSPPPGLDKQKALIAAKYAKEDKEWFKSELKVLKYQDEVMDWVKEQFKNLPEYGITIDGKELASFRKRFVLQGPQVTFNPTDETVVILESLYDGIPLGKKGFSASMNTLRIGAASRGIQTKYGGLLAKQIIRSLQGFKIGVGECKTDDCFKIEGGDCKTKNGFIMKVTPNYKKALTFLFVDAGDGKFKRYTLEEIEKYIGKYVMVRTPMYCKQPGKSICRTCCGTALANSDITLTAIAMGGGALKAALDGFHNKTNSVINIKGLLLSQKEMYNH